MINLELAHGVESVAGLIIKITSFIASQEPLS